MKEWFAHTDVRKVDLMMSSSITRVTRRNVRSFVPQAVGVNHRVAEIEILDDTLKLGALSRSSSNNRG